MVQNVNMQENRHIHTRLDVAGTGFTVLDRIYSDGLLAGEALGGSCANVLVSLAMLRRHVAPVLRLGADPEGERLVSEFSDAGALIEFIFRHADLRSPVLTEIVDGLTSEHSFSFRCPETDQDLPRFEPIDAQEREHAQAAFSDCKIFYSDRLSESILEAMQVAAMNGAIVIFEPSEIGDATLFEEAMQSVTILKTSADRLDRDFGEAAAIGSSIIKIVTHGASGLEVRDTGGSYWCDAISASVVRDACGSGDMVSVGLIDWIISAEVDRNRMSAETILDGVIAGQRLAAENCGFIGARGLFRSRGPGYARSILDGLAAV